MCRVVDVRKEECDVYVGRDCGGWKDVGLGNRFKIGRDGSREEVIEKYRVWFEEEMKRNVELRKLVCGLKGKRLGCWCGEGRCHGDVIVSWVKKFVVGG